MASHGQSGRTISVAIDSIASGGDGVGRADGLVVFVPRTAPGDVVTAAVTGRGHFARGALSTVVRPSPDRIEPPCPHYTRDKCGGCQLQHVTYPAQLGAKARMIADAMTRIGKRPVTPPHVVASDNEWRYRTKLTLAMRRTAHGWIAGLRAYDDPSRVFALSDCLITDRRVVAAWREVMAAAAHLPDARELRGSVRWTDDGPVLVIMGGTRWTAHADFFTAVPTLAALYWEPDARPRQTLGDRRTYESRTAVTEAGTPVQRPDASFAQVNPAVAAQLGQYVFERVTAHSPSVVIDAYSGSGDLAAALATRDIRVTAIELDADGAAWAGARLSPPSRAVRGRVEETLAQQLPADVVVVNPPRAGLDAAVPPMFDGPEAPKALVYVSCDPATLARDVARLSGYRIESMVAFDMFPQTSHVETVCELVREAA